MPQATAGELAVVNLNSSLQRAWEVSRRWPDRPGGVERIVDEEQLRAQFLGDVTALDRLATLAAEQCRSRPELALTHLVAAQAASMAHRFRDARMHLEAAEASGAAFAQTRRSWLSIKQAQGEDLPEVLEARRRAAEISPELQELVALGALLADLGRFEEAEGTYERALQTYDGVSPFAVAWVCFQLGLLWGELVPAPQLGRAALWYEQAIKYLPAYVGARVHLAEIYLERGNSDFAEALLKPVVGSGDPEVKWRLTQVMEAQGRSEEAETQREAARSAFEDLLARHPLAFADHGAEFYLSTGADPPRALVLARINLRNRPTVRAFELAYSAAVRSGEEGLASELMAQSDEVRMTWPNAAMAGRISCFSADQS
jgi:tetratricopeptide (TPR) repeat protein